MSYNVAPRYTPGSPASVDRSTAERVAKEEERAYQATLTGVYGNASKQRALKLGLSGIVTENERTAAQTWLGCSRRNHRRNIFQAIPRSEIATMSGHTKCTDHTAEPGDFKVCRRCGCDTSADTCTPTGPTETLVERSRRQVAATVSAFQASAHRAIDAKYNLIRNSERRWRIVRIASVATTTFGEPDVITFEYVTGTLPFDKAIQTLKNYRHH